MKAAPLLTSLVLGLISTTAFSYCPPGVTCGSASPGSHALPDNRKPADFEQLCYTNMVATGGQAFANRLAGDKALNAAARNTATATEQKLKGYGTCASVCKKYGQDRYDWGLIQNSFVPTPDSPSYADFKKWFGKPEPTLPGTGEFNACYGPAKLSQWCPKPAESGPVADIGNGPARVPNHLDGIEVCAQETAGYTLLGFSSEEYAWKHCARPQIVDALLRYKEERKCLDAEAAKPKFKQMGITPANPMKP